VDPKERQQMTATLYPSERKILRLLLAQKFGGTSAIVSRLRTLRCTSREMTGTGYYLNFDAQHDSTWIDHSDDELSEDFPTRLPSPRDLVGFTLFIRNGRLSWLEGYTFGDVGWPTEPMENWLIFSAPEADVANLYGSQSVPEHRERFFTPRELFSMERRRSAYLTAHSARQLDGS
jgi:hypothetical protein